MKKEIKEIKIVNENSEEVNILHRFLDKFNLAVEDSGRSYIIKFSAKKTGEQINVPVMGDILNYGDIVAFTDGTSPADLTKQDWINLYLTSLTNKYEKRKEHNKSNRPVIKRH